MRTVPRLGREQAAFTLVELLVVMILLGIVGAATLSVIVTTSRSNQFGDHLRTVMDDGRLSLDRVRKELRGGRRVLTGSNEFHLYWWNDRNQNGLQESDERIHYCMAELGSTVCTGASSTAAKFQLIRWTDDEDSDGNGVPDAGAARVIARTLTTTNLADGIFEMTTDGTTPASPVTETRVVNVVYHLDVKGTRGPDEIEMHASIRLRNVA